ncbi:NAD(P)/FAD-dependent oxidoreductase [Allomuricauda sp. d1]|uniref:NAD(P)/FAD-dependent oxidoreductase n=1 Tax=Allomuricauda sp. d1 TaxID=3136725 RepID=UPI0031CFC606
MCDYEVIVLGGGLAGLTAALHLSKLGCSVLVIEKHRYPRHKVCGEYVSNEVKPYLEQLGISFRDLNAVNIDTLQLSDQNGEAIKVHLPLGGFGLSRHTFDKALYDQCVHAGVDFLFDAVEDVQYGSEYFTTTTKNQHKLTSKITLGAFGKRSNLDTKLNRSFIKQNSPWLGVKCHYVFDEHETHLVGLHAFPGGYGGLSRTEDGSVNFCYLAAYKSFQKEKGVDAFTRRVVGSNPILDHFLSKARPKFEKPLAIAQISFQKKKPVENHVLMLGDSAGMIHPLCGNGMAMAIHSAKIAAETIEKHSAQQNFSVTNVEKEYASLWKKNFQKRLWMGRQLQTVLLSKSLSKFAIGTLAQSERMLQYLILRTHGEPILN